MDFNRSDFIVSSKVGRYGVDSFDFSSKTVQNSVDQSLQRLGLSYLDLCICHDAEFVDFDIILKEAIPTLLELKREGKIKHIGISGLPLSLFKKAIEYSKDIEFILSYCHYTLFDTTLQNFWETDLKGSNIGIINASPLSMGLLSTYGPQSWHPADSQIRSVCEDVRSYCKSNGTDLSQLALNFSLSSDFVTSTLVGMDTKDLVLQNIASLNAEVDPIVFKECFNRFEVIKNKSWPSGLPEYNQ